MKAIISFEYLFAAVLTALFFVVIGRFDWWWLLVGFLLFDVSMVGYLINNGVGAITYNIGHSLAGPGVLITSYILTSNEIALFIATLWLFHVFVDRALGFGLKHANGFHHTHLGSIGKSSKKR
ncbi:MAG: DUF4260 domain-containing protein [Candidatus Nomurabacteria bacterium]|nr:MAG: DUF4260 domain-containing protein [Candidatus Nomurabacteria bacterium]